MVDNFNLLELASSLSHTQQRSISKPKKAKKLYCDFSCPVQRPRKNIVFGMKVLFSCVKTEEESRFLTGNIQQQPLLRKGALFLGPSKKLHRGLLAVLFIRQIFGNWLLWIAGFWSWALFALKLGHFSSEVRLISPPKLGSKYTKKTTLIIRNTTDEYKSPNYLKCRNSQHQCFDANHPPQILVSHLHRRDIFWLKRTDLWSVNTEKLLMNGRDPRDWSFASCLKDGRR